jgi:hypothetical protein
MLSPLCSETFFPSFFLLMELFPRQETCLFCSIESYVDSGPCCLVRTAPLCGASRTVLGALSIRKPGMVQRPLLVQNSVCRMIPYTTCLCYRRRSANQWVIVHPTGQEHDNKVCIYSHSTSVNTCPMQGLVDLGTNPWKNNL